MPDAPTTGELGEIFAQLGIVYSPDEDADADNPDAMHAALLDLGLDEDTIAAEIAEQRGRDIPGRPE